MKKGDVIVCHLNISKNTTELDFHMCANLFQESLKYLPSVSPSSLEISIVPVEIRRKLIYGNLKPRKCNKIKNEKGEDTGRYGKREIMRRGKKKQKREKRQ